MEASPYIIGCVIFLAVAMAVCTKYSIELSRPDSARAAVVKLTRNMPLWADHRLKFAQSLPVTTAAGWVILVGAAADVLLDGTLARTSRL